MRGLKISLEKVLKTFEFAKVDKFFLRRFRNKMKEGSFSDILHFLKDHNEEKEKERGVKLQRPFIHGENQDDVQYQMIQEAYVSARLYNADERMLHSLWSDDWQIIPR